MQRKSKFFVIIFVISGIAGSILLFLIIRSVLPGRYKPDINLSSIVDNLPGDAILSTLRDLPDINQGDVKLSDDDMEYIYLFDTLDCDMITFNLCKDQTNALHLYERELKQHKISESFSGETRSYFVSYAHEDVCSGVFPTGEYVCNAGLLIDNLFISIEWIRDKEYLDESMTSTIINLDSLLSRAYHKNETTSETDR